METLKLLVDLQSASPVLHSPFLLHLFKSFSPQTSVHLKQALTAFHYVDEGDGLDFKAAYNQLSDWIFGWNISELNQGMMDLGLSADLGGRHGVGSQAGSTAALASLDSSQMLQPGSPIHAGETLMPPLPTPAPAPLPVPVPPPQVYVAEEPNANTGALAVHRVPRAIHLQDPGERSECLRILETFQTQYSMALRRLQRMCFSTEGHFAMIGKGLRHLYNTEQMMSTLASQGENDNEHELEDWEGSTFDLFDSDDAAEMRAAERTQLAGAASPLARSLDDQEGEHARDTKQNANRDRRASRDSGDKPVMTFSDTEDDEGMKMEGAPLSVAGSHEGVAMDPSSPPSALLSPKPAGARRTSVSLAPLPGGTSRRRSSLSGIKPESTLSGRRKSFLGGNANRIGTPTSQKERDTGSYLSAEDAVRRSEGAGSADRSANDRPSSTITSATSVSRLSANASEASSPSAAALAETSTPLNHEEVVREDYDFVYYDISVTMDLFLSCLVCCVVILAFSELTRDKQTYAKYMAQVHVLSRLFIQTPLKLLWQLIQRTLSIPPTAWSHAHLHELDALYQHLERVLQMRSYKSGNHPFFIAVSKLGAKVTLVHHLFAGFDVYMFPPLILAHKNGVKGLHPTSFDENVWVTSGYDGKLRIFDLSSRTCLAQYSGHRSIVTDVHFAKKDTYLVSCSFDKTLKIWNSQNATCEKTLTGHTDSVTTCDLSPDGKFIVSGSLDTTLRLWEFATGDCVATVKKHSKYVKQVQFSYDGRYVLSAGLDRRIYVWDIKILAYSKNITHYRCIEAHDDAILAMDMCRPGLLVSVSRDQSVKLWTFLKGQCLYTLSLAPCWACCVTFSRQGEFFAAGCFDNSVHLFDTKLGTRLRVLKIFNLGVVSLRIPQNNQFIVVGTLDGFIQKIDL